jgi:hypothetical protein
VVDAVEVEDVEAKVIVEDVELKVMKEDVEVKIVDAASRIILQ